MFSKFFKILAIALALLPVPAFAASPNAVRGLVYEWFGLFDNQAPVEDFLTRLVSDGLDVRFPERRLSSAKDFIDWYAGIQAEIAAATHELRDLRVTPSEGGWSVDLTVDWQAKTVRGESVGGLFHQVWRVVERSDGALMIQSNVITPVASPSSEFFTRVTTLAEVPAGEDYRLKQPSVESPTLLQGKRVALLTAPGVEDDELTFPAEYFAARGALVEIVTPWWAADRILTVNYTKPTYWAKSTRTFKDALSQSYDLVIVTGGPWNSGVLRNDADALALIQAQFASGRLLAPICSGSQVLIDTGLARGRTVTGAPNVAIDLRHAGGNYLDQPVVQDDNLVTGQDPRALPAFVEKLAQELLK